MNRDTYARAERAAFDVAQTSLKEFRDGHDLYPSDDERARTRRCGGDVAKA